MFEELFSKKGLSIERLNALVLLSEHGSLIKAAYGDFGLQSRYSHYLRELAEFVGTPLTKKDGRSIRLTPAGEELAKLAREQFRALLDFRGRAIGYAQQVTIGAGDSLLQWLLIPVLGSLRAVGRKQQVKIENLQTTNMVRRLQEQKIDLGIIRANAVTKDLRAEPICVVKYVVAVPRRLAPRRLTLESALLDCPHATIGGDGELGRKIHELAGARGGRFRSELICESAGQCMAAVRTGGYAAVVPAQVLENNPGLDCEVVDDEGLASLDRPVVLAWSPRNLEALGAGFVAFRDSLKAGLIDEAEQRGMLAR